ncbi:DUF6651 domain-containing protein [Vibrio owensii]|uniref:DUF6651 domain-containing protein n=1 Tax=Vibrio owensii TaxID=696485 RepID=UPI003398E315
MTKTTNNPALSVMEDSSMFKAAKPSNLLFGNANPAEMYRAKYSSICFVDGEGEGDDNTPPSSDDKPNDPPSDNQPPADKPDDKQSDEGDDKKDEKPAISDSEARLLKDVMKWKDKARSLETELKDEKNKEDYLRSILGDVSEDEIKELVNSRKAEERKQKEERGEYDSIVTQMKEQHSKDLAAKDAEIEKKDETIKELRSIVNSTTGEIEELTVGRRFSDSQFIKDRVALPMSMVRKEFGEHFEIENGLIVGYDKPRGSEGRAPLVDGQANTLGFEAAIERLITSHPESKALLRSTIKPGSGSRTLNHDADDQPKPLSGVAKIAQGLSESK